MPVPYQTPMCYDKKHRNNWIFLVPVPYQTPMCYDRLHSKVLKLIYFLGLLPRKFSSKMTAKADFQASFKKLFRAEHTRNQNSELAWVRKSKTPTGAFPTSVESCTAYSDARTVNRIPLRRGYGGRRLFEKSDELRT